MLGSPEHGISAWAFRITFDDLGRLILEARSAVQMAVSYGGQAAEQFRYNFKWILFPTFHLKVKITGIKRRGLGKVLDLESRYKSLRTSPAKKNMKCSESHTLRRLETQPKNIREGWAPWISTSST